MKGKRWKYATSTRMDSVGMVIDVNILTKLMIDTREQREGHEADLKLEKTPAESTPAESTPAENITGTEITTTDLMTEQNMTTETTPDHQRQHGLGDRTGTHAKSKTRLNKVKTRLNKVTQRTRLNKVTQKKQTMSPKVNSSITIRITIKISNPA